MNREMEDVETKLCENCKREIPTVNFTIHSVHCARNIRVCPVCKEPVLYAELKDHHEKLHLLQPCKKCGESVCGTDLEDHVRDSCAHTIKSCRFCELELPRRDLPAHENYCGVRTEQCPDCHEWVMIKYRQLHVDSNHGFIRLDDDPAPIPKKEPPKSPAKPLLSKMTNTNSVAGNTNMPSTSNGGFSRPTGSNVSNGSSRPITTNINNGFSRPATSSINNGLSRPSNSSINNRPNGVKNVNLPRDEAARTGPSNTSYSNNGSSSSSSSSLAGEGSSADWRAQGSLANGAKKRTNDQPQINTNVEANTNKVDKDLSISRGAVKKRPAPKPPLRAPPAASPARDLPYYSALQRQQREERARQEQNAYNLSVGLPPVLSAAEKIEKLRKMDALQNPESFVDYKNRVQGRMSRTPESQPVHAGHVLGSAPSEDPERRRQEFKNLKPMTPQEFLERFSEMQLRKDEEVRRNNGEGEVRKSGDRFSEIKSSLRELRRGLNEVTAPYHTNPNVSPNPINNNNNNGNDRGGRASPPNEDVRLPCEFCNSLIPAHNLVQHQTGCRPDLAQLRARSPSPAGAAALPRELLEPVIPCEFCAESLPVYLISEHQERCGREAHLLYPD
ncbi:hypothetical protein PYW08_008231 [Mythimna loreyi]|uniref:Uncharacterized protein n=1 Tax=Mythimna loreyi TaxID=667449 RepID=A0ACC2QCU3_9NEOP|nr:hypothetical protein PYW08_008231 [Mythimna loreyi]